MVFIVVQNLIPAKDDIIAKNWLQTFHPSIPRGSQEHILLHVYNLHEKVLFSTLILAQFSVTLSLLWGYSFTVKSDGIRFLLIEQHNCIVIISKLLTN